MKPLSERLAECIMAIAHASANNQATVLPALQTHVTGLIEEVKALEAKPTAQE